jgi:hypothetical protein
MKQARTDPDPGTEALNVRDAQEWIRLALRGDFAGAWTVSDRILARDARPDNSRVPRHLQRIWDGTPLERRRVLIRCYHGLGDSIQFIRYLPLVKGISTEVTVWAQRDLLPIFERSFQDVGWLALHDGTPDVDYDVDIEVMELPYAFRTTEATMPAEVPYLHVRPGTLPSAQMPRVGLVWRAGDWDTRRSIPFDAIKPLLDVPRVEFYGVQYDRNSSEAHPNLHPFPNGSVLSTARHLCALDVLVSIDSMPAHLAGALGLPVWTLLTHQADWRWMQDRVDSPWYPTMRLFRQPAPGDWRSVIDEVCESVCTI